MQTLAPALAAITDQIQQARASSSLLRIRGGGSKDFYGSTLRGEILDTRALQGIVSYEPSELVVTVQAGTPLVELEAVLREKNQCLPFEPPHFGAGHATVGGMVASGLSGPSRASVGGARDYVLGARFINGRGEHLTFGGQVMKNVAGYDVSRLMVGARGTLGLLTEVSLKVLPVAPSEATLCFALEQEAALEHLHRWGGEPLPLNASCWVMGDSAPGISGQPTLYVRLRGAVAAVEAACQKMLAEVAGQRMENAQSAPDWELCRNQQLPFFTTQAPQGTVLWRLSVPQTAAVLRLPSHPLIEWHGGLRWVWAPLAAGVDLQNLAREAGGTATLFVNPAFTTAQANATQALRSESPSLNAISQRLKASFDPQGIFNPGLVS